jgi:chemotaxis protein histidine kinase CheA
MSKIPPAQPEQQRFEDHSVIVPPHKLKTAVVHTAEPGTIAMDVVELAEAALDRLKGEFDGWMQVECDCLDAARKSLHQGGWSKASFDILFRAGHDIKGNAATFGFPLAGRLAAGMSRLLYHAPDKTRIPLALIDCYVEAIRAVVRDKLQNANEQTGLVVAEQLAVWVEKFLAGELKDAYAEIAADAAPALEMPAKPK